MFLISSIEKSWTSLLPARSSRRAAEVASVAMVACLATVFWPEERVTWESLDRIGIGMTRSEVRRILARWPDERFVGRGRVLGPKSFRWARARGRPEEPSGLDRKYDCEAWEAPGLAIIVAYDDGRVASRFAGPGHGREGWLARVFPSYRRWIARLF